MHELQKKLLFLSQDHNLSKLSLRKIGELLGGPGHPEHPQKVKHHLEQLIKSGMLELNREIHSKSAIKKIDLISIPILGSANCGDARMIAENKIEGFLRVSSKMLKKRKGVFVIKAVGDSMNQAVIGKDKQSIEEGDYVIINEEDKTPQNNSYVLSIIDGLANIKKIIFDKKNHQIVLLSESTGNYPPIFISEEDTTDYIVNGKVIQVIKSHKRTQ